MPTLHEIAQYGQSAWVDNLTRSAIRDGDLGKLIADGIVGVTTNPTIFREALSDGHAYEDELGDLFGSLDDPAEIFLRLAMRDVIDACDLLRPTWVATRGVDGYVSIEVDPNSAADADTTIAEATRFSAEIDRPNLLVKIPATEAALPAIEEMIARGVSINVTLIFGRSRYDQVVEAYLSGLERRLETTNDLTHVVSVASFFVSRVDTEVDRRLDEIGGHDHLKGRFAIANAKLAYARFTDLFAGARWDALAARGASPQRCLWASTSTKNPAYRDVMYVEELIGPNTVSTMPLKTIRAMQNHGNVAPTLTHGLDDARRVVDQVAEAGIDPEDVATTLERQGLASFATSVRELTEQIDGMRASHRSGS